MTAARQPAGVPTGGQFAAGSQARPAVSLDDAPAWRAPDFLVGSKSELVSALAAIRRNRPDHATIEWRHNARKRASELPAIDVPEGTVLTMRVHSGLPELSVASGRVVYEPNSAWGNAIKVTGGDVHVASDGENRKITVHIEPADGAPEPVVTTSPGEQDDCSRLSWFSPARRDMGWPDSADARLPEIPTGPDNIPVEWA